MTPLIDPDLDSPDHRVLITGAYAPASPVTPRRCWPILTRSPTSRPDRCLILPPMPSGPHGSPIIECAGRRTGARSRPPTWPGRCAAYRGDSDRLPGHLADRRHRSARHVGRAAVQLARRFHDQLDDWSQAWQARTGLAVAVTNEVGWGLVSPHRSGRVFTELLGQVNQEMAAASDEVIMVVAGEPCACEFI